MITKNSNSKPDGSKRHPDPTRSLRPDYGKPCHVSSLYVCSLTNLHLAKSRATPGDARSHQTTGVFTQRARISPSYADDFSATCPSVAIPFRDVH